MSAAAAPTWQGGGRGGGAGVYVGQNEGVCKETLRVIRAALGSLERQTEETCTLGEELFTRRRDVAQI